MKHFALIDIRTPDIIKKNLEYLGITIINVPQTDLVEEPISGHPDIQVFLHRNSSFVHPDIAPSFLKILEKYSIVKKTETRLSKNYPGDVPYNIAVAGSKAFHRKDTTDQAVADYLQSVNIEIINVNQGYSKCSTLTVDDNSIITADTSIDSVARLNGLDSLLIKPGYITLPGYSYGFIGGASGKFKDKILLTGRIDHHPDKESIYEFIESRNLEVFTLSDEPAVDTGSILIAEY